MLNTQELKATVSKLSAGDLNEFTEWFEEFIAQQWDNQIESDILAGRLDATKLATSISSSMQNAKAKSA
jgi:hypothetical protein